MRRSVRHHGPVLYGQEMPADDLDRHLETSTPGVLEQLKAHLRIPSISAQPEHAADVRRSAEELAAGATRAGLTAEVLETGGHPAVYAERMVDPALPTVLIYGHHDVQPVDPLDEWVSPPFEPTERDGALFARGAVDDKGQVWMHLAALGAHLAVRGEYPINVRLLVEGEEEIGSVNFDALVEKNSQRLQADFAVVSDNAMFARDVPSLMTGLRGLAMVDVLVEGPSLDLHSGLFGGAVANPVEALARIMVSLKDPVTGRVTVPGFYDDVNELSDDERSQIAALPFDEAGFRADAGGVDALPGEAGRTVLERIWTRPTLEFNGIWGGYQGPGSKTIIPARAGCKISCRLVPNQSPERVAEMVAAAVRAAAPEGVRVTADPKPGGRPVLTPTDHPAVRAAAAAMEAVLGKAPVFVRGGGSVPPVETFQRVLGIQSVLVGMGLPDDRIHAPNEKFDLGQFRAGTRVLARLWDTVPAMTSGVKT
jgi:acetylornithine deacetylase/succinyl-diaminopimelate desuccinylase-like protein